MANLYAKYLKESKDIIQSLNDIIDDVYQELKGTNLNLPYLDFSDIKYGNMMVKNISTSLLKLVAEEKILLQKKLQNLLDSFYTIDKDEEYTIEVDIDDANDKVSLSIWG